MANTVEIFGSLVGSWTSRWTVRTTDHGGMVLSGPNPPFYPDEGTGFATTIRPDGTGSVEFADQRLFGEFADESKQVLHGYWTDSEPQTGYRGRFCIMLFRNASTNRNFFFGVSQNLTGEIQAWYGDAA
jgi:hypothetical protein